MMAVVGSLQLSCELGVYKKHKYNNRFKQLDSLSFHLLNSRNRPIRCLPSRYNVVICRAFLPLKTSEIPVLTTAATTVTRSYNALHGGPFVLQLVPAVGFIVFAVWGLVPLMRHFRKLFCNQSESSWSSSTHCVATYYIRPFLIWTGAMLICRAFDPVALTSQASQAVKQRLLVFVRSLSTVLSIAYCLSSLIQQAQTLFMNKNDSKDTTNMGFQLAGNVLYTLVWVAAVSSFLELLGFPTTKWLTAGGFGGLLLTLAGREVFTNFLSSVMIQATRPFVLNDWIQTNIEGYEVSGTVEKVGWWTPTIIRGDDREAIHIPNHKFTVNIVRNLSQKTHWRIKTHLAISHLDVNKINVIVADMRKVLAKNPQVEQRRLHRRVFLENIDPENQALLILISCFVKTSRIEEYFSVKEGILVDLLRVISHHSARLATPIRTVQKIHRDVDMENIPFSDTIFTRAAAANTRPFLLIGPTYKSSGDDKPTAQARSVRSTEEQGDNLTTTFTSESKTDIATLAKPDPKTDTEVTEIILDPEEDYKVMGTPISESKEEMKVATGSSELKNYAKSETLGGNGIPATLSPDSSNPAIASKLPNLEDQGSAHSSSVEKTSSKQLKKVSSVDAQQKIRVGDAPGSASSTQSNLKADSEAAEVTLDSEADDKVTGTPVSEIEEVAVATSSSELNQQKSEPVAFTSPPDSTHPKIASNLPNSNTRRKRLNTVSSDDAQQSSMVDEAPVTASASALSSKSSLEDLHSVRLGSEDSTLHGAALKKPPVCDTDNNSSKGVPSNTLLGKQGGERSSGLPPPLTSRSSLENNIVLGMALEGSKRTLPIEEGNSSRTSADTKELIVRCNVCGSTFSGKDTKDNQVLTGLGDQREQKGDQ